MRFNNNDKLISGDDIILSDGDTLSERLSSHKENLDKLNSNVKWIYKYGGVGSGGGSGGGSKSYSIFASLNGIQISGKTITLPSTGTYLLYIKINNSGVPLNIKYSYNKRLASGKIETVLYSRTLSVDNAYTLEESLYLDVNGTISIIADDGSEVKSVNSTYVVTPYNFDYSIKYKNGLSIADGGEVFIKTAASSEKGGLQVCVDYNIAVAYDKEKSKCTYSFNNTTEETPFNDNIGVLTFAIDNSILTNDNAGSYSISVTIDLYPENQDPIKLSKNLTLNLIPESLYLMLKPEGSEGAIYNDNNIENPSKFNLGYINFKYTIYEGSSGGRNYTVVFKLNGSSVTSDGITIRERTPTTLTIFSNDPTKEQVLEIIVLGNNGQTYTKSYYFWVKAIENSIEPFDDIVKECELERYYYISGDIRQLRYKKENDGIKDYDIVERDNPFKNFKSVKNIERSVTSNNNVVFNFPEKASDTIIKLNTHLAIGLLYNAINSYDSNILKIKSSTNDNLLTLTQNKLTYVDNTLADVYIKKEKSYDSTKPELYHLILLISQLERNDDSNPGYRLYFYIDGKLEASFLTGTDIILEATSIELGNINYSINLLELDYFKPKIQEDAIINLGDLIIYLYYLFYKNNVLLNAVTAEEKGLLEHALTQIMIGFNGRVYVLTDFINNVASSFNVPIAVLTHRVTDKTITEFMNELEFGYDENIEKSFDVSVQWSDGKNIPTSINLDNNLKFVASIQGSSTKKYRIKNLDLELVCTDSDSTDVYLYSPNYDSKNTSTFLPEQKFTLKADVMDSSHSNNTACGRFVNAVSTPYPLATQNDGDFKAHVKNCLEGFPILVFLNIVEENGSSECIYLGIYNFNLGRSSYYNLGYKIFPNEFNVVRTYPKENNEHLNFKIYSVDAKTNKQFKNGLVVAEVLGGNPHFDFSQYDPTILFSYNENDKTYMFGDIVFQNTLDLAKNAILKYVEKVAVTGGTIFDSLKKKFIDNSDNGLNYGYGKGEGVLYSKKGYVPNFKYQASRSVTNNYTYTEQNISFLKLEDLQKNLITSENQDGTITYPIIDYTSLSEYYTICMVLGLVDNVMKNLNIKSWNTLSGTSINDNATWYTSFYDMDTSFGLDNGGFDTISCYAFSDYWDVTTEIEDENTETPSLTTIYRDYWPSGAEYPKGYDIPSTYLFAIAKYAKIFTGDDGENSYYGLHPAELYASWRGKDGKLLNADYFIENFYNKTFENIPELLISLNYKSKYFKTLDDGETLNTNISLFEQDFLKFKGTRINKTRDWLYERFHILDMYFNVMGYNRTIQYLNKNDEWEILKDASNKDIVEKVPLPNTITNAINNLDVYISKSIFINSNDQTSTGTIKINNSEEILFKTPQYSPLLISTANNYISYILGGDKYLKISLQVAGLLDVTFGGSQSWTELKNIGFITSESITITSNNLEYINGESEASDPINNITLNCPKIKKISLLSPKYNANLELSGINNFPNLTEIDISNSNMGLKLNGLNVTKINASNVKSNKSLNILNCNNLQSLNLSASSFENVLIGSWNDDFTIGPDTNIKTLEIICKTPGKTLTITDTASTQNDTSKLESLTVRGFENVIINNSTTLKEIYINDYVDPITNESVAPVKNIELKSLSYRWIKINSTNNNLANFFKSSSLSSLESIDFNIAWISEIWVPNNIKWKNFYGYALQKIHVLPDENGEQGCIIFSASRPFIYQYSLKDLLDFESEISKESGESDEAFNKRIAGKGKMNPYNNDGKAYRFIKFKFDENLTSLEHAFHNCSALSLDTVAYFINNVPEDNIITNLENIFYGCINLNYTWEIYKNQEHNRLNFSRFKKVNKFKGCFAQTKIAFWNKELFSFGEDVIEINTYNLYNELSYNGIDFASVIETTIDALLNILPKMTCIGRNDKTTHRRLYKFIDEDTGEPLKTVELYKFFNQCDSEGNIIKESENTYLTVIGTFNPYTGSIGKDENDNDIYLVWDLKDVFKNCINLTSVLEFIYPYPSNEVHYINPNGMFSNCPKLQELYDVLVPTKESNNTLLNLSTFFYKDKNDNYTIPTLGCSSDIYGSWGSFMLDKTITYEDYKKICDSMVSLVGNLSEKSLAFLFANCTITNYTEDNNVKGLYFSQGLKGKTNPVTKTLGLFKNCKLINEIGKEVPIKFYERFFENYPNINDVRYMFEGCTIQGGSLPFNFFNTREEESVTVYLDEELTQEAKLYTYTYKRLIKSYLNIFANCMWMGSQSFSINGYPLENRIVDKNDEKHVYNVDYYYDISGNYHQFEKSTEIEDIKFTLQNNYIPEQTVLLYGTTTWLNRVKNEQVTGLCIPPDFFYSVKDSVPEGDGIKNIHYDNAFSCNKDFNAQGETLRLIGSIPKHIFKNNPYGTVANVFKDQIIIPTLYYEGATIDGRNETFKVYTHFPEYYTKNTDISNAFNSHMMIASDKLNDDGTLNYTILALANSYPNNAILMNNAFGATHGNSVYGQHITQTINSSYVGKIEDGKLIIGIDANKLNNTEYIYNSPAYNSVVSGNLFINTNCNTLVNKVFSTNGYVIHVGSNNEHLSSGLKFPGVDSPLNSDNKLISYKPIYVNSNLLTSDITSYGGIFEYKQ